MKLKLTAGAALTCLAAMAAAAAPPTEVAVETGLVRGATENGVTSWKGIPFAASPVGALRWRAPQPASKWTGVKDASSYGPDCMQEPFPSDAAPLGVKPGEDCLFLNVWAPEGAPRGRKLPVMVWIYGGGFVNGGSSPPTYSGANLAREGVLFVSFNYRVGRFGTFAHPQLVRAQEDQGLVGNYGYMDQVAALKWVQRNIAKFGGDPKQVTIIGESAGGMSVNTLVTSPMAQGLFSRAIVMSGGNGQGMGPGGLAAAEAASLAFAEAKGIRADDPQALAKLRALSAEEVTDKLNMKALFTPSDGPRTFASPFVDGKLAVDAAAAYKSGAFSRVPMMIGATSADIGGKTGFMVAGARSVAAEVSGHGVPTYHYRFSYAAESLGKKGADHATEIPYFFDNARIAYGEKTTTQDVKVGKATSAYILNFVKTGDPNGAGLPQWPRYSRSGDQLMDFSEDGKAVPQKDPLGPEIDAAAASQAQGQAGS
ncbi:carboxylesterase family protein [Sphingomonas sp. PL-96]|uniref:carboxylesterase/lipase family protein n=1 Tax=Sphingomonas sp. PL-96 TaxID=2887201 RepID=UPI001E583B2B|nr:carboxylesterase family protein [Sphingomonas sp. PL-96]MCC2975669.1 carboxylesterase family protein [Sphingomonas sp. PL-96]